MSRAHQRFLVGQRNGFARLDGRQRRPDADHADNRVQEQIGLFAFCNLDQTAHAVHDHRLAQVTDPHAQLRCRRFIPHANKPGVELPNLLFNLRYIGSGGQCGYLQFLRVRPDNVQRLRAD